MVRVVLNKRGSLFILNEMQIWLCPAGNFAIVWSGSLRLRRHVKLFVAIKKRKGKKEQQIFQIYLLFVFCSCVINPNCEFVCVCVYVCVKDQYLI